MPYAIEETGFGNKYDLGVKGKSDDKAGQYLWEALGTAYNKTTGEEPSKGIARIKFDTNFNSEDKRILNHLVKNTGANTDYRDFIATVMILKNNYDRFKKSGYSDQEAMYRAIGAHNAPSKASRKNKDSSASKKDLDYVNKILYRNSSVATRMGKNVRTIFDEISASPTVAKNTSKIPSIISDNQ